MTVNELIQNVGQLSISEFEAFFNKIKEMRVQKLPNGMTTQENKICKFKLNSEKGLKKRNKSKKAVHQILFFKKRERV